MEVNELLGRFETIKDSACAIRSHRVECHLSKNEKLSDSQESESRNYFICKCKIIYMPHEHYSAYSGINSIEICMSQMEYLFLSCSDERADTQLTIGDYYRQKIITESLLRDTLK